MLQQEQIFLKEMKARKSQQIGNTKNHQNEILELKNAIHDTENTLNRFSSRMKSQ